MTRKTAFRAALIALTMSAVSACSGDQVVDNTAATAGFATKTVVKTTVGAGKLVYKGGKRVIVGKSVE